MRRWTPLLAVLGWLVLGPPGAARAQDVVEYRDPAGKKKDNETITGATAESPAGIRVTPARRGEKPRDIAAADIVEIRYKTALAALTYRQPFGKERQALQPGVKDAVRKRALEEALQGFQAAAPQVKDNPAAYRYMQFKIAQVLAHQAEDDPSKRDAAVAALTAFTREQKGGWETVPAYTLLARLQEEKGDVDGAGKTYAELAAVPGLPADVKTGSEVQAARALLRAGRYAEAERKLKALEAALPATDPKKAAAAVYLAQSRAGQGDAAGAAQGARAVLTQTSDPAVLGAAHNVLGDAYRKQGKGEDAFWEYLRVDVQYGTDREEHAKALYNLAELFDAVKNDKARAEQCLEQVRDRAQFGGTEYHKKAVAAKR
jgi:tetratricopeptide (TPR) repeat protein